MLTIRGCIERPHRKSISKSLIDEIASSTENAEMQEVHFRFALHKRRRRFANDRVSDGRELFVFFACGRR